MDIDKDPSEITIGWTSTQNPYTPFFDDSSFLSGTYFIFSLRIEKKTVPAKIVKKHFTIEVNKKLAETGKEFLSRSEKQHIKDFVTDTLTLRIPSTPNIFDLIWDYENSSLWFFTTQKAANEELETLFTKSFNMSLIRLFPYTTADLISNLDDSQKERLSKINETKFME